MINELPFFSFILLGWVFTFKHMVCEKCIIGTEKDKIINDILWKTDSVACPRSAVNFLFA